MTGCKSFSTAGSAEHEPALRDMKARWRRPVSGLRWYKQVQRDFEDLPLVEGSR